MRRSAIAFVLLALTSAPLSAQRYYPDDPLESVPELWPTYDPQPRNLSSILETFNHTFGTPGEGHPERGVIAAEGVNTLGEVMDGPWYVNRHPKHRFSREGLLRGPGDGRPPSRDGQWQVLTVKRYGFRPGMLIADATEQLYLLRFDPRGHLEMATGAEMVSSKLLYALGYNVPENYIVYFDDDQLHIADGAERVTSGGDLQDLEQIDIDDALDSIARDPERGYRAVATRVPGSWEGLLGPYQVFGTRSDDPNDVVPHEHRRDLRGLFVFSAWLNFNEMRAVNTLDTLVTQDDVPVIRHFLVDFTGTLGSAMIEPKKSREGNEPLYDVGITLKNIAGMGIYTPRWMRAKYPKLRAVGRLDYETFEPDRWTPDTLIAPFKNRLPDDTYWGARQAMTFTDDDLEAIASAGEYSDPEAEAWIATCLKERRDRLGQRFFAKVLPLDHFAVENGAVVFDDLEVKHGFVPERSYTYQWSLFDNEDEQHQALGIAGGTADLPPVAVNASDGTYYAVRIGAGEEGKDVRVYLRKESEAWKVVGIERNWPGKLLADSTLDFDTGQSRYADLADIQKELFDGYTDRYNETTGFDLSPQDYFDSLTISERTTYDAVTHALMNSDLTDEAGNSLGRSIDLLSGVERIAGQYYGRSGDEQFRLYVFLKPNARETLDASQEFALGHLNTVYHVGYPYSYRQAGNLPNMQFSISEDGKKADIDVDYRSSKMPQAMFNGHLTSSNSDVRAGDNHEKHAGRWGGFVAWWQGMFGNLGQDDTGARDTRDLWGGKPEVPTPLPPDRPLGAEPEELHDAAQEFLTDWLVRVNIDEAMAFISDRLLACVSTDDDIDQEILRDQGARATLRDAMEHSNDELNDPDNLTEAIDVVLPWRDSIRVVSQPYEKDFALLELTDRDASVYLCDQDPLASDRDEYGTYYGTIFRFKVLGSAVLGLLWTQEDGKWRIVSYEAFQQ